MRAINVLLTLLISLVIALLVFEGGLRLVGFSPPKSINEFHETLGWAKKPDARVKRKSPEFTITFETNHEGLRDDAELKPTKPAGVFRVLLLGDSFVLGYTVDRQDLFADQLEGWWKSEERRIEVINAGTEGYSTDQEALWFREQGSAYKPDVVVLFPYLNDIYWNGEERYTRYPKPRFAPDGTLQTSTLSDPGKMPLLSRLALTRFLAAAKKPLPGGPNTFQPPGANAPIQSEFAPLLVDAPAFLPPALEHTRGALRALQADCQAAGARLFLCPIPPETAVHPSEREAFALQNLGGLPAQAWDPMRGVNLFLELARELGIETMDPRQALQARADQGERLYFDQEWHFNAAGNRALTQFLYNEFENRQLLPDGHKALRVGAIPEEFHRAGLPRWMFLFAALWLVLTLLYASTYRDEPLWQVPLKIGAFLGLIFAIFLGGAKLISLVPASYGRLVLLAFVVLILGFVAYKLGRRLGTIAELLKAFTLRGHWYLMPLVVILLTVGSLLVVAASSPLIAPFIYTLF
jgi:hypothetical protein